MNTAIILAGGIGQRMKNVIPKQFIEINNKPVIIHTIEKFQQSLDIDSILVACNKDWIDYTRIQCTKNNCSKVAGIVAGGRTGMESLSLALQSLHANDNDLIIVHDAVRPLVELEEISDSIRVASLYGNAVSAVPCSETLLRLRGGGILAQMK